MKKIYKSNLRSMSVKNMEIQDGKVANILFNDVVLKEDILFYTGISGAYISFDYNTRLLDHVEAQDYIQFLIEHSDNPEATDFAVSYVDYNNMKLDRIVSNEEFKQMKKEAKEARKRK